MLYIILRRATSAFDRGVAQLVAHVLWEHGAGGSSPFTPTNRFYWPLGQAVKTPPFHGGNRGSSPLGVTINI